MKKPRIVTSSSKNKSESSWLRKAFWNLIGPIIVGLMAVVGQLYVNPIAAERVMIKESITQKRYEACEKGLNTLQQNLASVPWFRVTLPEGYIPPEQKPTQLELNVVYSLFAAYGKNGSIADDFLYAFGFEKNESGQWLEKPNTRIETPKAIGKFILKLREEMGIEGRGVDPNDFGYIFRKPETKDK